MFTLGTAVVALFLRNIVHAALLLTASWFGIAAFYLWAEAQFVAFAQALVYVGAVSMVVLFAVLLTRHRAGETIAGSGAGAVGDDDESAGAVADANGDLTGVSAERPAFPALGKVAAAAVTGIIAASVVTTDFAGEAMHAVTMRETQAKVVATVPVFSVRQIGESLIANHVGALLITGVLLTVALLGSVVLAAPERAGARNA